MMWRRAGLAVAFGALLFTAACGDSDNSGQLSNEMFRADTGCSAEGTVEITADGQAVAGEDVEYFLPEGGFPTIWCEGITHRWPERTELEGYVFESNPGDPLEFTVAEDGYVYASGSGTVTTPEGEVVEFP